MSSLRLEVGKTYKTRGGRTTGPVKLVRAGLLYPFGVQLSDGEIYSVTVDGLQWVGDRSDKDLIEEVREPKYDFNHAPEDNVNHPAHYTQGAIECIDAIKSSMSKEAFLGYLKGNVLKYTWRYENKGGAESLQKQQWYTARLIAELDEK